MNPNMAQTVFVKNMLESSIRIGLLLIVVLWAWEIISPFVLPIVWGAILAVALMPLADKAAGWLGGRQKLAINLLVLAFLLLLVVPF